MKLKLDENIGRRGLDLLKSAGHDVLTVRDQNLQGAKDDTLFAVCAGEGRALITLDHDFAQVLRFPPQDSAGIVVVKTGSRVTTKGLLNLLDGLSFILATRPLAGELWIVEPGRVRIHLRNDEGKQE